MSVEDGKSVTISYNKNLYNYGLRPKIRRFGTPGNDMKVFCCKNHRQDATNNNANNRVKLVCWGWVDAGIQNGTHILDLWNLQCGKLQNDENY